MKRKRAKIIKADHDRAVNKSISVPRRWFEAGCGRQQTLGYVSFSDYVQHLIREDVVSSGESIPLPKVPKYRRRKG